MKKKSIIVCLSMLFAAGVVFAQQQPQGGATGGGMGGGGGKGMMMRHQGGWMMGAGIGILLRHKDDLKLTPDQVTRLQGMRSAAVKDGIKRQADIKTIMVDVFDSFAKQPPDFNGARANIKKASDLKTAAKLAMVDNFEKAYGVLTKDQQNMLPSLLMRGDGCKCMDEDDDEDEDRGGR